MRVWSLGHEDPLEEKVTTHSSILAQKPMDREAWKATVQGVAKSQTYLSDWKQTYILKVNWVWKYLKCFSWPLSWPEENQRIFKNTDFQPSYITIFLLLSQRETFHSLISPLHTHLGLSADPVLDRLPLCQPPGFLKIPSPLFPIFLHIPPLKSMLVLHACSSVCFASSQSVLISGSMPKLVR